MFNVRRTILFSTALAAALLTSPVDAGLFNAQDYLTLAGGDWDTSTSSFIDFQETGSDGSSNALGVGDIIYMYQDFSTLGSVSVNGVSPTPSAVYGISAYKVQSVTDTTVSPGFPLPDQPSARAELTALGSTDFSSFLTGKGIDISEVTIGNDSTFVLVSSNTDVSLSSNGTTSFSSFEADLVAGLGGGFAQASVQGANEFYYAFYTSGSLPDGNPGFSFRLGLNLEGSDDGTASFGSFSASPFSGSSASVNISTQAVSGTTAKQTYGTVNNGNANSGAYYGSLDADLLTGATVPEPSSLAAFAALGLAGAAVRRKRNRE